MTQSEINPNNQLEVNVRTRDGTEISQEEMNKARVAFLSSNKGRLKMRAVMRSNVPGESRPFILTRSQARRNRRRQFAKDFPVITPKVIKKRETDNATDNR